MVFDPPDSFWELSARKPDGEALIKRVVAVAGDQVEVRSRQLSTTLPSTPLPLHPSTPPPLYPSTPLPLHFAPMRTLGEPWDPEYAYLGGRRLYLYACWALIGMPNPCLLTWA